MAPNYVKRLWVLYCKEWFRLKRNPAAVMSVGLIVLMAFLINIENKASQLAKRQEQLPCSVVYSQESDLIASLKASQPARKIRFIKVDAQKLAQGLHYQTSMRCLAEIVESKALKNKHAIAVIYKAVDPNSQQMTQFNRWLLVEIASLNPAISLSQGLVVLKEPTSAPKNLSKIDLGSHEAKAMIGAMMLFSAEFFLCCALFISFTGHEKERGILQALTLTTVTASEILTAKVLFHLSLSLLASSLILLILSPLKLFVFPFNLAVMAILTLSSLGLTSVAIIITSLNRSQSTASLTGFCYLMLMGVVFGLANKFVAFQVIRAFMFEHHAIQLFTLLLKPLTKKTLGAGLIHGFDLLALPILLLVVAVILFKRRGWRSQ